MADFRDGFALRFVPTLQNQPVVLIRSHHKTSIMKKPCILLLTISALIPFTGKAQTSSFFIGGSAGGNLAALLGARGSGSLTDGSRVAAVAELSGPVDLSYDGIVVAGGSSGLERIVLDYLDCESLLDCRAARDASAVRSLDRTDPPVFVGSSTEEFIPLSQSAGFAADLNDLGIVNQLVTVPGSLHSIGILDEAMRGQVSAFLHEHLDAD